MTNDISYSKPLTKALPDRVFRQIILGDLSPEVAKRFVITHLDQDELDPTGEAVKLTPSARVRDLKQLDECIEIISGRQTDLEYLSRRLRTGQTPQKALAEIIEQR